MLHLILNTQTLIVMRYLASAFTQDSKSIKYRRQALDERIYSQVIVNPLRCIQPSCTVLTTDIRVTY